MFRLLLFFVFGLIEGSPIREERSIEVNYFRGCYFTNWAQYRPGRGKFNPEDYVAGLCTHMFYAFAGMNADFTITNTEETDLPTSWAGAGLYNRVNELKKKDTEMKTIISIGGYNFGVAKFKAMASTSVNRKKFIDSALVFIRKWGFDGIDIDWEYPDASDMANFATFIKELKKACVDEAKSSGKSQIIVTAAVSAGRSKIDSGYDVSSLSQTLDFIMLMSYDFYGAWDSNIGFNAPLYSRKGLSAEESTFNVDSAANRWAEKGMPREKIIVGIATYGRGWNLPDSNTQPGKRPYAGPAPSQPYSREIGMGAYYEMCESMVPGGTRYWHAEQQVPYIVKAGQWWSYDDTESITIKVAYVKKSGFGGAFVWSLDFDDFNGQCPASKGQKFPMITIILKELGGKFKPQSTTTTPQTTKAQTTKAQTTKAQTTKPPTTTAAAATTKSTAFSCPAGADGFFPDPANCLKFYRCYNGQKWSFDCPPGTSWHADRGLCDYTDMSKCG